MKLEHKIKENTWLPRYLMDCGWGNGYVILPPEHPLFGVDYNDIDVDVHGCLTYGAMEDENWVVGFDTAHFADTLENWPEERVEEETIRLKEQLENYSK